MKAKIAHSFKEMEIIALLRLQAIPKCSDYHANRLVKVQGSAQEIFSRGNSYWNELGWNLPVHFFDLKYLEMAKDQYLYAFSKGYWMTGVSLSNYPKSLLECEDAPLVLFSTAPIVTYRNLSIVGTRKASAYALEFTRTLIEKLVPYKVTIVSGMALGIDGCAHQSALDQGLKTIACLGHGLNYTYPETHRKLRQEIERKGVLLSEFWCQKTPKPFQFVKRNRIIAGLSEATIVIESPIRGGSLITASLAESYHRDVFALPNRAGDEYPQGCNQYIRDCKAQLITSAADVISFMGWD